MQNFSNKIKNGVNNVGKKITAGGKAVGSKIQNNSEQIKKAGKTVAGAFVGSGTVENLTQITKDKKKGIKGLAKAGLVIGVMVAVGILAAPLVGPLAAAVFAIGAGIATPKIASSIGSKGMEYTKEERREQRTKDAQNTEELKKKIQEKQKAFEKSASQKKKLGIAAISIGVIATILTGGATLPVLLGGMAIGGIALKSSGADKKKSDALKSIDEKSSLEEVRKAAVTAGILKKQDIEFLQNKEQGQEAQGEKQEQNNNVSQIELKNSKDQGEEAQQNQNKGQEAEQNQNKEQDKNQNQQQNQNQNKDKEQANERPRSQAFSEPSTTDLLEEKVDEILKKGIKGGISEAALKESELNQSNQRGNGQQR